MERIPDFGPGVDERSDLLRTDGRSLEAGGLGGRSFGIAGTEAVLPGDSRRSKGLSPIPELSDGGIVNTTFLAHWA
jgi:hypothetical protein